MMEAIVQLQICHVYYAAAHTFECKVNVLRVFFGTLLGIRVSVSESQYDSSQLNLL